MREIMNKPILAAEDRCVGCSACKSVCPVKCITMSNDKYGFYHPLVNESQCINCKKCEHVCPDLFSITKIDTNKKFEIIDITSKINELIDIDEGIISIFSKFRTQNS